jgi:hypothetical protein
MERPQKSAGPGVQPQAANPQALSPGFYGTSKNAVLIQIWTALTAYLLLVWLKFKSKTGWGLLQLTRLAQTMLLERCWGLLQLTRLAQTMLLERCDLWGMLCPRPPDIQNLC